VNLIVDATLEATQVEDLLLTVEVVDFLSGYSVPGVLQGFTAGEVIVSLQEPLSEQQKASVHLHSFAFEGQILYCRPKATGYEAHITIDDAEENGLRRTPRFAEKLPARPIGKRRQRSVDCNFGAALETPSGSVKVLPYFPRYRSGQPK
jgi:hypothetical protein